MAIDGIIQGPTDGSKPIVVLVPGLFGAPDSLVPLTEGLTDIATTVLLDLYPQNRESGLADSSASLARVSYDDMATDMRNWLVARMPGQKFHFMGVSLGGKIVVDIGEHYPEIYASGLLSDVSPGPFQESDLYRFIDVVIPSLNMTLDWPGLKLDLRAKIPQQSLRVFIQTQIVMKPEGGAAWKPAVRGFKMFLDQQKIGDQWAGSERIPGLTTILKAAEISGVADSHLARLRSMPNFVIEPVENATHFIHVTHPQRVRDAIKRTLLRFATPGAGPTTTAAESLR